LKKTEPWIDELMELGVGALAIKTLYRMRRQGDFKLVCSRCGYEPKKWAATCPHCRVPLVRRRKEA